MDKELKVVLDAILESQKAQSIALSAISQALVFLVEAEKEKKGETWH